MDSSTTRSHLIIGLSGATNGGKSTLSGKLQEAFPASKVIEVDDYFWPWPENKHKFLWVEEVNHANWEDLTAIDMESLMTDVQKWIQEVSSNKSSAQPALLFIEGILSYNYKPLVPYFDRKYFLTLDKETCSKRRIDRNYIPPDPPGYFEKCVWPMYLEKKEELVDQDDIVYIDGREDMEQTFQRVLEDVLNLIGERK